MHSFPGQHLPKCFPQRCPRLRHLRLLVVLAWATLAGSSEAATVAPKSFSARRRVMLPAANSRVSSSKVMRSSGAPPSSNASSLLGSSDTSSPLSSLDGCTLCFTGYLSILRLRLWSRSSSSLCVALALPTKTPLLCCERCGRHFLSHYSHRALAFAADHPLLYHRRRFKRVSPSIMAEELIRCAGFHASREYAMALHSSAVEPLVMTNVANIARERYISDRYITWLEAIGPPLTA